MSLTNCPECQKEISDLAESCPHCGVALKPKVKWYEKKPLVIFFLFLFCPVGIYGVWKSSQFGKKAKILITVGVAILLMIVASNEEPVTVAQVEQPHVTTPKVDAPEKWYVGGNLHQSNAIKWQNADYHNKLATSADIIAALWKDKKLIEKIQSRIFLPDDIKPFAKELVVFMDKATEKNPDPELNKKMFTNQKVNEMAVMGVIMMGWTK